MWEEGEEGAILVGMDLNDYWNKPPRTFKKYIKIYMKKEEERVKEWDYLNYLLGKYIAYAVNDPKKYPRKPFLQKETQSNVMTNEDMERIARLNTIKLGGKIK